MEEQLRVVCAWCGAVTRVGDAGADVSHGICASCAAETGLLPVDDLSQVDAARLDALPFGVIRVVGDGRIVAYNAAEGALSGLDPGRVVGKHFFRDVAPCAAVREFEGRLAALREQARDAREEFTFVFKFEASATLVRLVLAHVPAIDTTSILVQEM